MAAADSHARRAAVAAVLLEHPGWGKIRISAATGIPRSSVQRCLDALKKKGSKYNEPPPSCKKPTLTTSAAGAEADSVGSNIHTLEDLLKACRVDLEVWEVERHIINKWEVAMKVGSGEKVTALHRPLVQIKAWLKRRQPVLDAEAAAAVFRAALLRQVKPVKVRTPRAAGDYLFEISIPDLHLGKLAWGKETGHQDCDSEIAARVYLEALEGLLQARPAATGRFLLPLGNDFFNVDSDLKQTTGGTPQDEDGRWQRSFKAGCQLAIGAIRRLTLIAPVDVVMIAGNHDYQRVYYLGVVLEAAFGGCEAVTINNEPTQRKYLAWGDTLLGFTHGDKERQADLPLIMATERPELWSRATTREWHLGHEHKEKVSSKCGVTVRIIPSLCPPESWHAGKGYVGAQRQASAFVYDRRGLVAQHLYTVRE